MSLVPTFVQCADGNYYKELVYRGKGWFICFDDDDPVELVIKTSCAVQPKEILTSLGIQVKKIEKHMTCHRAFGNSFQNMVEARSYFLIYPSKFPTPRKGDTYDAKYPDMPKREGVFYKYL